MQVNAINAALGRKVAEFRKAHGWSQAQLAEAFGAELGRPIDPTQITRLEQGKRPVALHELIALSHVLAVEPTVFFKFLGPLDDVLAAMRFKSEGLRAKAKLANLEAQAAETMVSSLEALRRYRDSGALDDLSDGLGFLFAGPQLDRQDWRELLLDASVPDASIRMALKAAPGFPGEFADPVRGRFLSALMADVADAPKRRRKTGRAI